MQACAPFQLTTAIAILKYFPFHYEGSINDRQTYETKASYEPSHHRPLTGCVGGSRKKALMTEKYRLICPLAPISLPGFPACGVILERGETAGPVR